MTNFARETITLTALFNMALAILAVIVFLTRCTSDEPHTLGNNVRTCVFDLVNRWM